MGQTYEKWEMHIGKKIHIVSKREMELIINAGEARFVKFRDLVVNPAFVEQFILVESESAGKLAAVYEGDLTSEEWIKKHAPIDGIY